MSSAPFHPFSNEAIGDNFELVNGFYVQKNFITEHTATTIHDYFFKTAAESRRDKDGELDIAYECWELPEADDTIAKVCDKLTPVFPEWRPNDITLRDTNRGFETHQDDRGYMFASAIVQLSGITKMTLQEAEAKSPPETVELVAGDLLILRQSTPLKDGGVLDTRTWHGANLNSLTPGSCKNRSFLYLGYINNRLAYAA